METTLYRMDTGGVYTSNCFPARNLFRTSHGGAGHWLVSQKTPQENNFRTVVCSSSSNQKRRSEIPDIPHRSRSCPSDRTGRTPKYVLDAAFLMKVHRIKDPSDLCSVDVSDKHLTAARPEEFVLFHSVAYINAAENALALENFRTFLQLRELELPLNKIWCIKIELGDFPHLEVLDLSYNSLSPGDITQLGVLPRLRVLYLTGNELTQLPPDLTAPPRNDDNMTMFPCLEILMLDNNRLSHPSVFVSLAGLISLRLLNLDNNGITAVPYLHQSESSLQGGEAENMDTTVRGSHKTPEMRDREDSLCEEMEEKLHYMVLPSTKDPDRTEVILPSIQSAKSSNPFPKPPETTISSSILPSFLLSSTEELIQSFTPPLPSLTTLSLADNKIEHEEDLLAVALFPSLEELVIHGNPVTTRWKGDPRLLKSFLQERLGMKITRKKMAAVNKPHLVIPIREKRKVSTHVPKIPKQPLMIEPPLHPFLRQFGHDSDITEHVMSSSPLPPIRTSSERDGDTTMGQDRESSRIHELSEEEIHFGSEADVESVFMTQVDDQVDQLHCTSLGTTHKEQDVDFNQNLEHTDIPEKFRGYEEFYDVKTDPDFIEPIGIQNNVRALEHALRRLHVYHDCKPILGSNQKPYIPRESQLEKEIHPVSWKSKKELFADVLTSMRERRHLVEVPLESALEKDKTSREHKEARRLMKDLHRKYDFFQSEAVKFAAELEGELRDTAKELLEAQSKLGHWNIQHGLRHEPKTPPK